jgi:hypothetical protein
MRSAANLPVSPTAIVRHGFTRAQRIGLARREPAMLAALDDYDADVRMQILALCDAFAAKHGTWQERHG